MNPVLTNGDKLGDYGTDVTANSSNRKDTETLIHSAVYHLDFLVFFEWCFHEFEKGRASRMAVSVP